MYASLATTSPEKDTRFTPRQQEVLDLVLELLVEEGNSFSMAGVASRANCSKESLYKWFGDRDGMLAAAVQMRARDVRVDSDGDSATDFDSLRRSLESFAANWLRVVSTVTSLALNRVAMAHAGSRKGNLGNLVLAHGRFAIGERLKPVLEEGRDAGLLSFGDSEEAFRVFFGLIARDVQIRLLLGDELDMSERRIRRDAREAAGNFLVLYGRLQ